MTPDELAEILLPGAKNAAKGGGNPLLNYEQIKTPQRIIAELAMAKMDRAIYSERQLYEQMVDFWFNHFNVFAGKGVDRWLLTSYERDAIRPHAMGKFRDLLEATAKSPAMLFYLDNWQSVDPRGLGAAATAAAPCAKPIARDSAGLSARRAMPPGANANAGQEAGARLERKLRPRVDGAAHAGRGRRIYAAGRDRSGARVHRLDDSAAAARSGVLISTNGCTTPIRRWCWAIKSMPAECGTAKKCWTCWRATRTRPVIFRSKSRGTSSPTIRRTRWWIAWRRRIESTDGDIRAVLHTMIYSPEFWSRESYRAKIKTPFELVASAARAVGAETGRAACRWCSGRAASASRSINASRRRDIRIRPTPG